MDLPLSKYARAGAYHWDAMDGSWKNRFTHYSLTLLARYARILNSLPRRPSDILEIGCGDGALAHLCARRAHRVTGLDLDATGVDLARKKTSQFRYPAAPRFSVQEASSLISTGARFDVVILADVIEHLEDPDTVLKTAQALLRPGGLLLVTTPLRRESGKWDPLHVFEYTAEDLKDRLAKFSRDVRVVPFHPYFLHRLYGRRAGRALLNGLGYIANPFVWHWPGMEPAMLFASARF